MGKEQERYPSPEQALHDVSALADGTLDLGRRQDVERWIEGSPHLRALYEREREAVAVLRYAAGERAPARLRARLDQQRRHGRARPGWKPAYAALAGVLACAIAALALFLPGGTPGSPSISQAARLALLGPSGPPPPADAGDPRVKLARRVDGLYFPNWATTLGWRPVGTRTDHLGGRSAVTVYYQRGRMSVAYTIVSVPALAEPAAPVTNLDGFRLQALQLGRRAIVTWRRAGHTCVLSASGVPVRALERLADWPAARLSE
jgi:hypothetical protein